MDLGIQQQYSPGLYARGAVAFGEEEKGVLRYLDDWSVLLCHRKRDGVKGEVGSRTTFMFGHGQEEITVML